MARRADCPDPKSVAVLDIYPNDDLGRHHVASLPMEVAYVQENGIYTPAEMRRYSQRGVLQPSWEQGKEEYRFVAYLFGEVVGLADLTRLSDGWRLVEPMHVLPRLRGCGIGTLLWERCANAARQAGAPGLRVWSFVKNPKANQFYLGRGCSPVATGSITLDAHVESVIGYECRL